jgi:hypothetical protein
VLEPGESFLGRYRGEDTDSRGNSIPLFWDEAGEPCFFWSAYRLSQAMEREQPAIGATCCVVREDNFKTRFDLDDEPTGKSYGVASKPNDDPLPESPAKSEAPF